MQDKMKDRHPTRECRSPYYAERSSRVSSDANTARHRLVCATSGMPASIRFSKHRPDGGCSSRSKRSPLASFSNST